MSKSQACHLQYFANFCWRESSVTCRNARHHLAQSHASLYALRLPPIESVSRKAWSKFLPGSLQVIPGLRQTATPRPKPDAISDDTLRNLRIPVNAHAEAPFLSIDLLKSQDTRTLRQ